jgi:Cd2+/Zn2+-exporting ATPase
MSSSLEKPPGRGGEAGQCLARSVVDTLAEEPALEAVTIDREHRKISVATLGRAEVGRLTGRITTQFQAAGAADPGHACSLLNGLGDCRSCAAPLSETERQKITIQNDGPTTTIARVTCPTAPKFWRWRDIPFPKVVQRDVEFLESVEHIEEHINE